jgi:cation transport regulator
MPYGSKDSLSKVHGASKYKGKSKRAFIAAFNSCYEKKGTEESRCYAIAHHAAQGAGKSSAKK